MASDKVKTFTDTNFESETKSGVVLVDFWAEWCGPCRRIAPIVEELASDYEGKATIGKMNVDENPNIPTSRFQVRGIPTLVVLKNGHTWEDIQRTGQGAMMSITSAIFILLAVGALIGTWNLSGTIPTLVYYGIQILSPGWYYVATALICGAVAVSIGTFDPAKELINGVPIP